MEIFGSNKYDAIRRTWDPKTGNWYYSIMDVIALTTKSSDPRNYWKVLKNRLKNSQNKLVTGCNQLKMVASDGKSYLTDAADEDTILGIVKLVSGGSVLPLRAWFDELDQKAPSGFGGSKNGTSFSDYSYPQETQNLTENDEELLVKIDGYSEKNTITIQAFMAGIEIENLIVSVTCKTVTIKGERKIPKPAAQEYLEQELFWGKFSRTIDLPNEIEIDDVEASEYHGLLTIKLPLINKERSKLIKVKTI